MAKTPKCGDIIEIKRSPKGPWRQARVSDRRGFTPGEFQYMPLNATRYSWTLRVADEGKTWRRYVDLNKPLKVSKPYTFAGLTYVSVNDVPVRYGRVGDLKRWVAELEYDPTVAVYAATKNDAIAAAYAAYVMLQRRKP